MSQLRAELQELAEKNMALGEALGAMRIAHQDCERKLDALQAKFDERGQGGS